MIDFAPIFKTVPIFVFGLVSPGPDFMLITTLALTRGRFAGVLAAAGIALGNGICIALCIFGLGFIVAKMAWLMVAIRICGGAYLIYIGFQLWKGSFKSREMELAKLTGNDKKKNPFAIGLLTNMTNPKALAFFSSMFALVSTPETSVATQLAMIVTMPMIAFSWFSMVSLGLSTSAMRRVYMKWSQWVDRMAGTFLALFGLKMIFAARK